MDALKTVVEYCELSLVIQIDFFMYFCDSMCTFISPRKHLFSDVFLLLIFLYTDTKMNKDWMLLGWYNTRSRLSDQDIKAHKEICTFTQDPIMLQISLSQNIVSYIYQRVFYFQTELFFRLFTLGSNSQSLWIYDRYH